MKKIMSCGNAKLDLKRSSLFRAPIFVPSRFSKLLRLTKNIFNANCHFIDPGTLVAIPYKEFMGKIESIRGCKLGGILYNIFP
jgi:hypothetical protein